MSTVVMHDVVSLDGFVADLHDDPGPLFDWYFNVDQSLDAQEMTDPAPGGLRVSRTSSWCRTWSSGATACSTSVSACAADRAVPSS